MWKNLKRLWSNLKFLYLYADLWAMDQDIERLNIHKNDIYRKYITFKEMVQLGMFDR